MPPRIEPATAEQVVEVTDAVLLRPDGADEVYVADFCQLPIDSTRRALHMAEELQVVSASPNGFVPRKPFARYLISANSKQRAAVFRLLVEEFPPFELFKRRLALGETPADAADRVRAVLSVQAHREDIKETLLNFGQFSQSLVSEGAGAYRQSETSSSNAPFLEILAEVAADLERARYFVLTKMGPEAQGYFAPTSTFDDLATAYTKLYTPSEAKAAVVYAGNAVETALVYVASGAGTSLAGASGINQKADRLVGAGVIKSKHLGMLQYLGHIRNAAGHGADPALGQSWGVERATAIEYVHVAMSCLRSVVVGLRGQYVV